MYGKNTLKIINLKKSAAQLQIPHSKAVKILRLALEKLTSPYCSALLTTEPCEKMRFCHYYNGPVDFCTFCV